jgi:hypothetical protein
MAEIFWSEDYCYLLDLLAIAHYPVTNRVSGRVSGHRFPDLSHNTIESFGNNEARDMTGLSSAQLHRLYIHLRVPDHLSYVHRYSFIGEEAFLHYMVFNRMGETKLKMSRNYFGGDPRRFTYSIRLMTDHIYDTFYHKISGDSMRYWIPSIPDFRLAIWNKVTNGVTVELANNGENDDGCGDRVYHVDMPYESFRIFGFLDDTGFRTTAPGIGVRRRLGFNDDVQRSFYSGYFGHHGLKIQAVTLPNGMFGSVFIGALRVSDAGLLNMSGLDTYLSALFREFNMHIVGAYNQLPALYGDGIFPQLATIVARYRTNNSDLHRINRRMASVRESIEHLFALHTETFDLFNNSHRLQLLLGGVQVSRLVLNSFFLLNCYTCMNESPNDFTLRPPTLEEYIPIDEILRPAPVITDAVLGGVYNYN